MLHPRKRIVGKKNRFVPALRREVDVKQRAAYASRADHIAGLGGHFPRFNARPCLIPPVALVVEIRFATDRLIHHSLSEGQVFRPVCGGPKPDKKIGNTRSSAALADNVPETWSQFFRNSAAADSTSETFGPIQVLRLVRYFVKLVKKSRRPSRTVAVAE